MRDIVVIGASAGGIEALQELLPALPADLACSLIVLVHRPLRDSADFLPPVLQRRCQLPVVPARDWDAVRAGCVHVVPPGCRAVLESGFLRIQEHRAPPSLRFGVDELFQSAAVAYRQRVVAIVLSGMLSDGAAGLRDVRRRGGITVVQDPAQSRAPSMASHAVATFPVHHCLAARAIGRMIVDEANAASELAPQPSVLIVEDDWLLASDLASVVTDLGYRVVGTVASGEEALDVAASVVPDVVLMDIQLAGNMKGTDAGKALSQGLEIPVVYVSAYSDEKTLIDVKASRPSGFVVKPYRAAQVHAALQVALAPRLEGPSSTAVAFAPSRCD